MLKNRNKHFIIIVLVKILTLKMTFSINLEENDFTTYYYYNRFNYLPLTKHIWQNIQTDSNSNNPATNNETRLIDATLLKDKKNIETDENNLYQKIPIQSYKLQNKEKIAGRNIEIGSNNSIRNTHRQRRNAISKTEKRAQNLTGKLQTKDLNQNMRNPNNIVSAETTSTFVEKDLTHVLADLDKCIELKLKLNENNYLQQCLQMKLTSIINSLIQPYETEHRKMVNIGEAWNFNTRNQIRGTKTNNIFKMIEKHKEIAKRNQIIKTVTRNRRDISFFLKIKNIVNDIGVVQSISKMFLPTLEKKIRPVKSKRNIDILINCTNQSTGLVKKETNEKENITQMSTQTMLGRLNDPIRESHNALVESKENIDVLINSTNQLTGLDIDFSENHTKLNENTIPLSKKTIEDRLNDANMRTTVSDSNNDLMEVQNDTETIGVARTLGTIHKFLNLPIIRENLNKFIDSISSKENNSGFSNLLWRMLQTGFTIVSKGRGKKDDKGHMLLLSSMIMGGILLPMAFAAIALIAKKAVISSLVALVLSAYALSQRHSQGKKVYEASPPQKYTAELKYPPPSSGHSSSPDEESDHSLPNIPYSFPHDDDLPSKPSKAPLSGGPTTSFKNIATKVKKIPSSSFKYLGHDHFIPDTDEYGEFVGSNKYKPNSDTSNHKPLYSNSKKQKPVDEHYSLYRQKPHHEQDSDGYGNNYVNVESITPDQSEEQYAYEVTEKNEHDYKTNGDYNDYRKYPYDHEKYGSNEVTEVTKYNKGKIKSHNDYRKYPDREKYGSSEVTEVTKYNKGKTTSHNDYRKYPDHEKYGSNEVTEVTKYDKGKSPHHRQKSSLNTQQTQEKVKKKEENTLDRNKDRTNSKINPRGKNNRNREYSSSYKTNNARQIGNKMQFKPLYDEETPPSDETNEKREESVKEIIGTNSYLKDQRYKSTDEKIFKVYGVSDDKYGKNSHPSKGKYDIRESTFDESGHFHATTYHKPGALESDNMEQDTKTQKYYAPQDIVESGVNQNYKYTTEKFETSISTDNIFKTEKSEMHSTDNYIPNEITNYKFPRNEGFYDSESSDNNFKPIAVSTESSKLNNILGDNNKYKHFVPNQRRHMNSQTTTTTDSQTEILKDQRKKQYSTDNHREDDNSSMNQPMSKPYYTIQDNFILNQSMKTVSVEPLTKHTGVMDMERPSPVYRPADSQTSFTTTTQDSEFKLSYIPVTKSGNSSNAGG